jgi:hypothetical protein
MEKTCSRCKKLFEEYSEKDNFSPSECPRCRARTLRLMVERKSNTKAKNRREAVKTLKSTAQFESDWTAMHAKFPKMHKAQFKIWWIGQQQKRLETYEKLVQAYGTTNLDCIRWRQIYLEKQNSDNMEEYLQKLTIEQFDFYMGHSSNCPDCARWYTSNKASPSDLNAIRGKKFADDELEGWDAAMKEKKGLEPDEFIVDSRGGIHLMNPICPYCGRPLKDGRCLQGCTSF